jgi:DNA-binding NarL/FixJ family response regulator
VEPCGGQVTIDIRVVNPLLERCVRDLLVDRPLSGKADDEPVVVLTDRSENVIAGRSVLIVPRNPVGCAEAVRLLAGGHILGAVLADEIDAVPSVLSAVDEGFCVVPQQLVLLAAGADELTERQVSILEALIGGLSNRQIAHRTSPSEATVKRELSRISAVLKADNRYGLVAIAYARGFLAND